MKRQKLLSLVLGLAVVAGCSKSTTAPGGGPPPGSSSNVTVGNNFFQPSAITVAPGTTVKWTWAGGVSHDVTFDDGTKSATQSSGTYSRTFSTAGVYHYHCTIHGTMMSGTVTVESSTNTY